MTDTTYSLVGWKDRIYKIGPDKKYIPKRDENGNIIYNSFTGFPEYETMVDGTRVNEVNLGHMDEGILAAHHALADFQRSLKKIQMQLELDGRVPGANGNFVDTFDELPTRMTRLTAKTDVTAVVTAGDTVIPVSNAGHFEALQLVTIYDADGFEHVRISSVDQATKKLRVAALTNDYSKGAKVARSIASVDAFNQSLIVAPFTVFQVDLVEVV